MLLFLSASTQLDTRWKGRRHLPDYNVDGGCVESKKKRQVPVPTSTPGASRLALV